MATNHLCTVCDNTFDEVFSNFCHFDKSLGIPIKPYNEFITKFSSLTEWESTALSCRLCAMFYHARNPKEFERYATTQSDTKVFTRIVSQVEGQEVDLNLHTSAKDMVKLVDLPMKFELHRFGDEPTSLQPAASPTTWSPATVKQLKSWLLDCTNSHHNCNPQSKKHRLPLRLIDVDPSSCIPILEQSHEDLSQFSLGTVPMVLLCSTSGLPKTTEYLTLSHRWDPSPSILLSNTTLSLFAKEIPLSLLNKPGSKTFKDAIVLTRSLGFRYLWIDTVCINQDDEAEKSSEITFMDKIYSNSSCNISATGAARGADGLFFERSPLVVDPCRKSFATPNGSTPFVDVVASLSGRWRKYVTDAPVNTRGWVYQERMLAPRVMHFAQDQVYWECCTIEASEASSKGAQGQNWDRYQIRKKDMMTITRDEGYMKWVYTTEIYTCLFLTFPRDKLLAISAVARHFCTRRGLQADDYLAGCWRPDLPHCLNWTCKEYRPRSGDYVAPSWSWASIGAPIGWGPYNYFSKLVDIVDISITPKYGDYFGEIVYGHIRFYCSLCQALWWPEARRLDIVTNDSRTLQLNDSKTLQLEDSFGMHFRLYWDYDVFETGAYQADEFWLSLPDDRLYFPDNVFYLMPLQKGPEWFKSGHNIFGLILYRTLRRGQYVRVGGFSYLKGESQEEDARQAEMAEESEIGRAFLGKLQVLDAESSLEDIVDGKCLIEIV